VTGILAGMLEAAVANTPDAALGMTRADAIRLLEIRGVAIAALEAAGLEYEGGGIGFGAADAIFILPDGRELEITVSIPGAEAA